MEAADKHNPAQQPSARHTEEGERFNRALFAAVDALNNAEIPFGLIGGVAASGMGRPRATHDIDMFVRPEDAEAAVEALAKNGFRTQKTDYSWLFKGWKEEILVDIIFKSSGDIYYDDEMQARTRLVNFHGRKVPVVAPEDFIIIKCAVHNEIGPHHWHDALAVLAHATIDWEYLLKRSRRAPRRLLALLIYGQSNDILVPNSIIHQLYQTVFGDAMMARPASPHIVTPMASGQKEPAIYVKGHIKDALAKDQRTGDLDLKIDVGSDQILLRGEVFSEVQKNAAEEICCQVAPGYSISNRITVPHFTRPEGSETIQ
ncbi:MAG TPA: nucleotidyltransferase [Bdellovibrionales bacterium]|nr:nucleotidyltransferase [Bdellovibrionales bacterium]